MSGRKRSWTINQLKNSIKTSTNFAQTLRKLSLRPTGGNYDQLKKYIKENGILISHFTGHAWNKGLRGIGKPRIPLEKVLARDVYFQSYQLKRRLFNAKLKPEFCEHCGWAKRTPSGHLPLELDHINGDRRDNRLANLRVLCPNCHSLTPHHRGRTAKKYKEPGW